MCGGLRRKRVGLFSTTSYPKNTSSFYS